MNLDLVVCILEIIYQIKLKKGAYVINLDEYENTGTHWVSLCVKPKYTVYFDSFGIEHIPKEINKFINNDTTKSRTIARIKSNIIRIQAYDSNKYRLDEINKIRDYFNNGIKERKDIIKKLNKYLLSFDYLDKIFIDLSASFGTLSIASYASYALLTLMFTIGTGISKLLLKVTEKRKKKHNKIIALAKNKFNTIDTLLSTALNDSEISHEEFTNIITETNIYENIKENIKELTIESSEEEKLATL